MISIRKSQPDASVNRQERDLAFNCYLAAVRSAANYIVEFDDSLTIPHRQYLTTLAESIATAQPEALHESRATLRGLMRDYRDKAAQYLSDLREQLASTASALVEMVESLSQSDGEHDVQVRSALKNVRQAAEAPEGAALRNVLCGAVDSIQRSLEEVRKQHQVTIAQFQTEIRMLHKRIDSLEKAASVDSLTKLFTRREMEDRIRNAPDGAFTLLLIQVSGFRLAELNFSREVSAELTSAFSRRLGNSVPEKSVIGRWSEEEFVAITQLARTEAVNLATHLAEHLGGSYSCLQAGKTVHPTLQLRVGVVDSRGDSTERILQRITEILTGTK